MQNVNTRKSEFSITILVSRINRVFICCMFSFFSVSTTTEDKKPQESSTPEVVKLTVKRARPKAASPNRQGPQQCQVSSKSALDREMIFDFKYEGGPKNNRIRNTAPDVVIVPGCAAR